VILDETPDRLGSLTEAAISRVLAEGRPDVPLTPLTGAVGDPLTLHERWRRASRVRIDGLQEAP
jgi:hypothetical protein